MSSIRKSTRVWPYLPPRSSSGTAIGRPKQPESGTIARGRGKKLLGILPNKFARVSVTACSACTRHPLRHPSPPSTGISLGNSERYRRLASGHSNLPPCRLGETTSFSTAHFHPRVPRRVSRRPFFPSQSGKSANVPFTSESCALIFQSRMYEHSPPMYEHSPHLTPPVYLTRALFRGSEASEQGGLPHRHDI